MDEKENTTSAALPAADEKKSKKPRAKKAKAKATTTAKAKAKGKDKAKGQGRGRKSTVYEPSAKLTESAMEDLGSQAKVVAATLVKTAPTTLSELAKSVASKLTTKQYPKRVVAFYLTQFKSDGLVKKAG